MRKIALAAIALALFLIPGASVQMASAASAQQIQSNQPVAIAAKNVADVTPAPASNPEVTVQSGDTLIGIATANGTTYTRLYDANSSIADPNLIYPGDEVRIPASDEQLTDRSAAPSSTVVTVNSGDTLDGIAAANGTTTQRLYDANGSISDPNVIYPGDQVTVPTSDEQLTDRAMPAPAPAVEQSSDTQATADTSAATPVATTAAAVTSGTPDNSAKAYIYMHESSNNPDATNWLGCYGLGQDCNGLLKPMCGDDYACQDRFFDNYAQQRYGGWANAQAFWEANGWW